MSLTDTRAPVLFTHVHSKTPFPEVAHFVKVLVGCLWTSPTQSAFVKYFKQQGAMSPREYRYKMLKE